MKRRDFLRSATLVATVTIALPSAIVPRFFPGTTVIEAAVVRPRVLEILFAQDGDDWARDLASYRIVVEGMPEANGLKWARFGKVPMVWLEESTEEEMRESELVKWVTRNFDLADAEIKILFNT